ncbi:MAG: hypothetical protein IPP19_09490 [Verrucomicrobia bacterium]|nr:hypothetical protein [Verrucomicrobiota bacterium]
MICAELWSYVRFQVLSYDESAAIWSARILIVSVPSAGIVRFRALPSYAYDGSGRFATRRWIRLRRDDYLHGVMEREAEDLHEEVDGVAGL